MIDFAAARRTMVDCQVRPSDVTDLRIIAAMLDIPRERFVPEDKSAVAYLDRDVVVNAGAPGRPARCLLKPMVLAKLIQVAAIAETERVLDVACASGYSSAVLARLAASVVALEEDPDLAATANRLLKQLAIANVAVETAPLAGGAPAHAPYDVILVNGAFEVVPRALLAQLDKGGRLLGVSGAGPAGKAVLYRVVNGNVSSRTVFDAGAPLLPGFAAPAAFVF
jgi:protein-L-isoaspartate(D-aspartate) O-methyltransferase